MPKEQDLGKDKIIFLTEQELSEPSKLDLPQPEPQPGLILEDGSINWNCPCLGGMATGPCGVQFREAFSCFHYSIAEQKGSDCMEAFSKMHSCMQKYPTLYGSSKDDESDLAFEQPLDGSDTGQSQKTDANK